MSKPFDPDALARGTDSLQVEMVRRVSDEAVFEVAHWLPTMTQGEIHALRPKLRQGLPEAKFECFCCRHEVLLKQHATGGHYFAHKEKTAAEKADCLYQQEGGLSLADRDRLRYQGQREGPRHKRTKDLIVRILRADPRFAEPKVEERWTSFADGWRQPDVATVWNQQRVVFEAQVSNTYPQIVAERTEFYRKQGALLIWIFDRLPDTWRTLHADAFCANSQQLFLVDEESATRSETQGQACFHLYAQRPDVETIIQPDTGRILLQPVQKEFESFVEFGQLTLDIEAQTATIFDAAEESRRARHKALCAQAQADNWYSTLEAEIRTVIQRDQPIPQKNVAGWAALVCGIEAMRLGKPVGTRLANTAGVLNLIHDQHPSFIAHLVQTLERLNLDPPAGRRGAWKKRVEDFYNGRYKDGPLPEPHKGADHLLAWLYAKHLR